MKTPPVRGIGEWHLTPTFIKTISMAIDEEKNPNENEILCVVVVVVIIIFFTSHFKCSMEKVSEREWVELWKNKFRWTYITICCCCFSLSVSVSVAICFRAPQPTLCILSHVQIFKPKRTSTKCAAAAMTAVWAEYENERYINTHIAHTNYGQMV